MKGKNLMKRPRFEKFEMKYGYYFPEDFKEFMYFYGGDTQFGSCRFEYPDNIINNLLRIPGKMDFHLIPFGDVGNGDYYCFYRYGIGKDEYFIGIWLHETYNFVILTSSFKGFLYKCMLDDYLATIVHGDELSEEEIEICKTESMERCIELSKRYGFDFEKVKKMRSEFDYHKLMVEFDEMALQSLCFLGKNLIKKRDLNGLDILKYALNVYPFYTAPYYLLGISLLNQGKDFRKYFKEAVKTSVILTGYSYWEEDYLEIPEDVHREIALYVDNELKDAETVFEKKLYLGADPYDYSLRLELAREYILDKKYHHAMVEYNNAIFCTDSSQIKREILEEAYICAREYGLCFIKGIIEHDLKYIR
ncbi:SMI1/KNR4 family protein [Fervidicella metallireducens]|nr:SMI1/KNR4 family protein [Fervidicella metallireducens]